jgi:uncharacterized protein (TIGR02646 family)
LIQLQRGPTPSFWTREQVKSWTKRWLAKDCEANRWSWPQYLGKKLNQHAREAMESWHHSKCAFCEAPLSQGWVEHFRSKTQYPLAAFVWLNLFLSCEECNQAKGVGDHQGCLKPDREDPTDYLWVNPISRKIEPKPGISEAGRQRAARTIELFRLDRPELRKLYEKYLLGLVSSGQVILRTPEQAPLHLAGLRALARPDRPFSLMVKSLLEYHGVLKITR